MQSISLFELPRSIDIQQKLRRIKFISDEDIVEQIRLAQLIDNQRNPEVRTKSAFSIKGEVESYIKTLSEPEKILFFKERQINTFLLYKIIQCNGLQPTKKFNDDYITLMKKLSISENIFATLTPKQWFTFFSMGINNEFDIDMISLNATMYVTETHVTEKESAGNFFKLMATNKNPSNYSQMRDLYNRCEHIIENLGDKTNIITFDGHGRTLYCLLYHIFKKNIDRELSITIYEIDDSVHRWHELFFPQNVTSNIRIILKKDNIYNLPRDITNSIIYLNFMGIGRDDNHVSLSNFLDYFQQKPDISIYISFETRYFAMENILGYYQKKMKNLDDFFNNPKIVFMKRLYNKYDCISHRGLFISFVYKRDKPITKSFKDYIKDQYQARINPVNKLKKLTNKQSFQKYIKYKTKYLELKKQLINMNI
jgi:hypothetical protein